MYKEGPNQVVRIVRLKRSFAVHFMTVGPHLTAQIYTHEITGYILNARHETKLL